MVPKKSVRWREKVCGARDIWKLLFSIPFPLCYLPLIGVENEKWRNEKAKSEDGK